MTAASGWAVVQLGNLGTLRVLPGSKLRVAKDRHACPPLVGELWRSSRAWGAARAFS